jgi:Leucine-rich repeat (LRR) protein
MLSGTIPSTLDLPKMETLSLFWNDLTDTLPFGPTSSSVTTIALSNNNLSGSIDLVVALKNTTFMNFNNNQFTGIIPQKLCQLTQLELLGLGLSNFTGKIPDCPTDLTTLTSLSFYSNFLIGSIVPLLPTSLVSLFLGGNGLTGILNHFVSFSSLGIFLFDDIHISSTIPSGLGDLASLQSLALYQNLLSGTVPSELGKLTTLQILSLFDNISLTLLHFSGELILLTILGPDKEAAYSGRNTTLQSATLPSLFDARLFIYTYPPRRLIAGNKRCATRTITFAGIRSRGSQIRMRS